MNEKNKKVVSISGSRSKSGNSKGSKAANQPAVICSFCGRPNHLVIKMIQGPGVNICSECTMICVQYLILEDKVPSGEAQKVLDAFWQEFKK